MTITITGTVRLPNGDTHNDAQIIIGRLGSVVAQSGGVMLPSEWTVTTDATGDVSFTIEPGSYVAFSDTDFGRQQWTFTVDETPSTQDWADRVQAADPVITPALVQQAIDARDAAAASAALALAGSPYRLEAFADLALRLRYSGAGSGEINVFAGDCIDVPGIGSYVVLSSSDPAPHLDYTGSGGVKLSILDLGISPAHFGAVGDASADDSAAFQAAFDLVFASWNATVGAYERFLDGGWRTYRIDTSIDMTAIQQNGIEIRNLNILGRCAGKPVLDASGTRSIKWSNVHVFGDAASAPSCGFLFSRIAENSFAPAPQHKLFNCSAIGTYTVAARVNFASEVYAEFGCEWSNKTQDYEACAVVDCLNPAELLRVMGKTVTSDYTTLIDDFESRSMTTIGVKNTDIRSVHSYSMTLTAITQANPAVCTYSGDTPSGFGNDSHIYMNTAPGMTGVALRCYCVKNHNAGSKTFQLYEVDGVTTKDTTGAGALSSNALAYNRTGPALFLNGVALYDLDGYLLSYNDTAIILAASTSDGQEALFPSEVNIRVSCEKVGRSVMDIDVGSTNRTIRGLTLELIDYAGNEEIFQRAGTGTVTIYNHTLLCAKATGSGLSNNICHPESVFSIYGADYRLGNDNFFDPAGWADFRGVVMEPRGITTFGTNRIGLEKTGQTLTDFGLRRSATDRYTLYRSGIPAERHIQYQDSGAQGNIEDRTHRVNTTDKWTGKMVWDTTNRRPLWARGAADNDAWTDGNGTVIYTPV